MPTYSGVVDKWQETQREKDPRHRSSRTTGVHRCDFKSGEMCTCLPRFWRLIGALQSTKTSAYPTKWCALNEINHWQQGPKLEGCKMQIAYTSDIFASIILNNSTFIAAAILFITRPYKLNSLLPSCLHSEYFSLIHKHTHTHTQKKSLFFLLFLATIWISALNTKLHLSRKRCKIEQFWPNFYPEVMCMWKGICLFLQKKKKKKKKMLPCQF